MEIGLINELHGAPGGSETPSWESTVERAKTAEAAGFDSFVYEDVLLYPFAAGDAGVWESTAISGALAVATESIRFGPSVINAPYRSPAVAASTALTLGEISGGRYIFGVGAGNTPDYELFGIDADPRYSRFAEWIEIAHGLVRGETVTHHGTFHTAADARLPMRPADPVPIVIAAGGPKMMKLAARYADEWNWWVYGDISEEAMATLKTTMDTLDAACEDIDRDPATLRRSIDLYSVAAPGIEKPDDDSLVASDSVDAVASAILTLGSVGIDEVRCNVLPQSIESIAAMADVVEAVHRA